MKIEYMRWYEPGTEMMRCGGDEGCGALLVSGDMEQHTRWHERVTRMFKAAGVTATVKKGHW